MSLKPEKSLRSLDYMSRFQCIGPDCEDHCCSAWDVYMNSEDYERLGALRGKSELVAQNFEKGVERLTRNKKEARYARLRFDNELGCLFQKQGLCMLHAQYGEPVLPTPCSTYPRKFTRNEDHFELSGSLSCPEVARLCLLAKEPPHVLEVSMDLLPRKVPTHLPSLEGTPFGRWIWPLRAAVMGLLGKREWDLHSRLYLIAYFGRKLCFLTPDMTAAEEKKVSRILKKLSDEVFLQRLLGDMNREVEDTLPLEFFISLILRSRDEHARRHRFIGYVQNVYASYGFDFQNMADGLPSGLWDAYIKRRQRLLDRFGERINQYLENYTVNVWHQVVFHEEKDLASVVSCFVLCFAAVKFLLVGHSAVPALLDGPCDEGALNRLDEIAVEAVQVFSKNISHNQAMLAYFAKLLDEKGYGDLDAMRSFLFL